jgi:non-ribosomal peptide synthase protein (TIGR01720 family)
VRERLAALETPPITFNYLGQFSGGSQDSAEFQAADEDRGLDRAADNPRPHLLNVTGGILDGELAMEFDYSRAQFDEKTITALAGRLEKALYELAEESEAQPELTLAPEDFPLVQLNQKKLDRVLSQLDRSKGKVTQ